MLGYLISEKQVAFLCNSCIWYHWYLYFNKFNFAEIRKNKEKEKLRM